jgi:tetratricopeptide (TPR) repeat protein
MKVVSCCVARDRIRALQTKRILAQVGALFFIFSACPSFAQLDPGQFIDRKSSGPQTVSRNELLAPAKAVRAIERAKRAMINGHFGAARKDITRALGIAPHLAVAKVLQGAIEMETNNYEAATDLFQQAIDDDPAMGGAYAGMAVVLIHEGRFRAALPLLDRAEGLLPTAWFVHFEKAWAELQLEDTQAALKQADSAERIAGTNSEKRSGVFYLRAMVYVRAKDMETARKQLAEAVESDPGGAYAAIANKELERLQLLLAGPR